MAKQTIAVDIDDVLSAAAEGSAAYRNEHWGNKHKAEDYTEAWAEFWQVPIKEALGGCKQYYNSNALDSFKCFEDAVPALRRMGEKYNIVVIMSHIKVFQDITYTWLNGYFPGIFSATWCRASSRLAGGRGVF